MMESGSGDPAAIEATFDAIDRFALAANGQFVELVEARAAQLREEWLRIGAIGGALSLLALISVVALVRQGVIRPLRRMTEALGRLADGDITAEVPATRFDDEIAALGGAMRRFKQALEDSRSLSRTVVQSTMHVRSPPVRPRRPSPRCRMARTARWRRWNGCAAPSWKRGKR